tara:strand:+ start:7589 stop:8617 length:1029 start_codon:yes stop_codon:yes gene_type:complete
MNSIKQRTTDAVEQPIHEDLQRWAASLMNASEVTARKPDLEGRSREIWIFEGVKPNGDQTRCVVRNDTGQGPWSGTSFTLEREARTLRALNAAGIPVPGVLGTSADGQSIAIEFLEGTATFDFPARDLQKQAVDNYLRALVSVHQLEIDGLNLPFARPTTPKDPALLEVEAYRQSYESLCAQNDRLDEAFHWLAANAPAIVGPASVLQGDAGPGNFLHIDGKITGLVDWEAAHFGDPMDDLAWLWFRKCFLRKDPDLGYWYRRYAELSGRIIDLDRISYYRVMVLTRAAVSVHVRQAHDPLHDTRKPALMLDLLKQALIDPYGRAGAAGALQPFHSIVEESQ